MALSRPSLLRTISNGSQELLVHESLKQYNLRRVTSEQEEYYVHLNI